MSDNEFFPEKGKKDTEDSFLSNVIDSTVKPKTRRLEPVRNAEAVPQAPAPAPSPAPESPAVAVEETPSPSPRRREGASGVLGKLMERYKVDEDEGKERLSLQLPKGLTKRIQDARYKANKGRKNQISLNQFLADALEEIFPAD